MTNHSRRNSLTAICVLFFVVQPLHHATHSAESLRVMTFNIWHGGEAGGQPLDQTIKVIEMARADLVGLQEKGGSRDEVSNSDNARRIADKLGWNYFDQGEGVGIITRYQLGRFSAKKHGTEVVLPSGRAVWHFNVHFAHAPYQPYQLLNIPYFDGRFIATEEEAIAEANAARAQEAEAVIDEISTNAPDEDTPVFITGDFNEPSALDWTTEAVQAGACPIAVRWPTTASFFALGFQDSFRKVHPDPVRRAGLTWTPITSQNDPKDHHDRIDFVLFRGVHTMAVQSEVIGENSAHANIVVNPYPSDHRSVVSEIRIDDRNTTGDSP